MVILDKPKNILVVQNDQLLIQNLTGVLEKESYNVIPAQDGLTGIELACNVLPDLIICDIVLPRLNGYGLLAALRFNEVTETIPVIFLSANNDKSALAYGMLLGAVDYITKPFLDSDLIKTVNYHLKTPETRPIAQVEVKMLFSTVDEVINEPTRSHRRFTFLEKVENAIRLSNTNSVEKRLFLNEPVSPTEIEERIKVLWQRYDKDPSGSEGLIAVWLKTKLV